MAETREFADAQLNYERALRIRRQLAQHNQALFEQDVAGTLCMLGTTLRAQDDNAGAQASFEESILLYRRMLGTERARVTLPSLAMSLVGLGNLLHNCGQLHEAEAPLDEAVRIYSRLAEEQPETFEEQRALSLNSLGGVYYERTDLVKAQQIFEEAAKSLRRLFGLRPSTVRGELVATLSNLANVFMAQGRRKESLLVSRQAVDLAEQHDGLTSSLWLVKGPAFESYRRLLSDAIERDDVGESYEFAAALRSASVRTWKKCTGHSLDAAVRAIDGVTAHVGRRVRILLVQELFGSEQALGILDSSGLVWFPASGFKEAAARLYAALTSVFMPQNEPVVSTSSEALTIQASEAWNELPEGVRSLLTPSDAYDVLISADPAWKGFPWEALCYDSDAKKFLGLESALARWNAIDASSFDLIANNVVGNGAHSAAIICPWNVGSNPAHMLESSRREASALGDELHGRGYSLEPGGKVLMGRDACSAAVDSVFAECPAIVHYTGHGALVGNEEVLVLHGGGESGSVRYYGRKELDYLKRRLGRSRLFSNGPLITMNSCQTGRSRSFGGRQEDLASTLLAEGAGVVIASSLPVFDVVGRLLGESLYQHTDGSDTTIGDALVHARQCIDVYERANHPSLRHTWAFLSCFGNPYSRFARPVADAGDVGAKKNVVGFAQRFWAWKNIRKRR